MADELARVQQYEYRQNSNLVLQVDYQYTDRRSRDEPTGEVMALNKDLLHGLKMGDRYQRTNAPSEKKSSGKNKEEERTQDFVLGEGSSSYKPRTQETKNTYDVLLAFISEAIGDQPGDILHAAAEMVLGVLKSDTVRDKEKRKDIEGLLNKLSDERYALLFNLSKKINDFNPVEDEVRDNMEDFDETSGVPVQFDEDEEEDKGNEDDKSDEDDDIGVDAVYDGALKTTDGGTEADGMGQTTDLHPRDIDAHWIQRALSKFYEPIVAQEKVKETSNDDRACENALVLLLQFERFDFIKILRQHRHMIYYCTRLKQAQPDERKAIEKEMSSRPELQKILNQLQEVENPDIVATEREIRDKNAQQRRLAEAGDDAVSAASWSASRKILDLDELAFTQGSHLMSSKRCALPEGTQRTQKKSYETIFIPALKPKPFEENEKLIQIEQLPAWARPGFAGYRELNRIQSKISPAALHSDGNLLICAPTGAGKTNVALMCILRELSKHMNDDLTVRKDEFKCIYVAPMRSLVQEMVGNFKKRLEPYDIQVLLFFRNYL